MSVLKKNIIANFAGSIWQVLMGLVFIPLYIKFMGVESYGLIGIFASLQAMFALLDMGLSTTLNREMARLSVLPGKAQEMRDLVRSLEIIYWGIAVLIGIVVVATAPLIAYHWVKPGKLSPATIQSALRIMGCAMALQWPFSFYSGGLMGLQKQVLLNAINIVTATLRGAGAVLILWLLSPTIQAFFTWQIVISITNTLLAAFFLWGGLPHAAQKAVFQRQLIKGVWRFAAGMSGITVLAMILTQLDKIILSKMLSLEMFGYYTLAWVVAMSISRITGPVFSAVYPRFTELVALADADGLKQLYHKSCQFMSVLILPIAAVIALFSYEVLLLWTRSPVTAEKVHLLVTILVCGTALNGLMNIPYGLQLAHGWTRLAFYVNLMSVILLVPLIIYMTSRYGAVGGASVWAILNTGYVLIAIQYMHKRLLPGEKWRWYWQDVCTPLLTVVMIVGLGKLMWVSQVSQLITMSYIFVVLVMTIVAAAVTTSTTRNWLLNKVRGFRLA